MPIFEVSESQYWIDGYTWHLERNAFDLPSARDGFFQVGLFPTGILVANDRHGIRCVERQPVAG